MSAVIGSSWRVSHDKTAALYEADRSSLERGGGVAVENLPACTKCRLPIADRYVVRVRGSVLHTDCAVCAVCVCPLRDLCFVIGGQLLCRRHYHDLYAIRCATCKQPMLSHELCMRLSADEVHHVSCFVCSVCRKPLASGVEYAHDPTTGALFCKADFLNRGAVDGGGGGGVVPTHHPPQSLTPAPSAPAATAVAAAATTAGCCVGSAGGGGKRGRTTLSQDQRAKLQRVFEDNPRPPRKVRETLAREFGLPVRVVQVWFQNQRAREKKLASCHLRDATSSQAHHPSPAGYVGPVDETPSSAAKSPQYRPSIKKSQFFQWNDSASHQQW
uniref:LIM/homeobox protein Lhx9 n=1 Tax=Mesocestoides corti TaxID=53468 RepID=A0A5K3ERU0_MESCO